MWKFLQVSKHMNHLLKAPFCVHPKTGNLSFLIIGVEYLFGDCMLVLYEVVAIPQLLVVYNLVHYLILASGFAGRVCVPIDPQKCETFDPTTVPTLSQVWN